MVTLIKAMYPFASFAPLAIHVKHVEFLAPSADDCFYDTVGLDPTDQNVTVGGQIVLLKYVKMLSN